MRLYRITGQPPSLIHSDRLRRSTRDADRAVAGALRIPRAGAALHRRATVGAPVILPSVAGTSPDDVRPTATSP